MIFLILINLFWIQGIMSSTIFQSISSGHEDFFSPKLSSDVPAVAKVMGMYGFWRESSYTSTYASLGRIPYFILLAILLAILLFSYYITHDKRSKIFYTLFWIGLVLGTGISHPYTRPFFDYLFKYLPFFSGFRDSHKLVSLIALSYAYFLGVFVERILSNVKKLKFLPILIIIGFILFFTFPLLGLNNQIRSVSYPQSYNELN